MSEFYANSPFSKHIAKEVLILLGKLFNVYTIVAYGLNVNYYNNQGMTPLMMATHHKLKGL